MKATLKITLIFIALFLFVQAFELPEGEIQLIKITNQN